ncbi:glycoside hydrolase family 19 protein [Pseudoroseomonas ludipueritiae]|uniref:Glycoside hydrolase family 19 protein n=1 Tax=Pseudoroseomonas ludipueritiae TaxID=198093 RepID=A0ABR7R4Q2_9PROT|nr:glycoside hydrolase family 19 protein [Pseudoroseomonas ludipueritiae]MBC9176750.1 glycoside hydrolase family 19 protein [Pseudoroseomonas ludipueritiae]
MINLSTTIDLLKHMEVRTKDVRTWAEEFDRTCATYDILAPRRRALFLANGLVETGYLSALVENMNYSADRLQKVFGARRISAKDAQLYGRTDGQSARQPDIANTVYGGEWGLENLGNTQPNDGWYFRGRGFFQLTGRANYKEHAKMLGLPITALPDRLETIGGALDSAGFYWDRCQLNPLADREEIDEVRRRINGGSHGLAEVKALYKKALAFINDTEGVSYRGTASV